MAAHWTKGWRARSWSQLQANPKVDVLIIGGGITGVGVLREAARAGLRVLLVEKHDFASGTSSRSSKMVHGGLRYLGQYHFGLTRDSVKERERLSKEAPGLVNPGWFLYGRYHGQKPRAWEMRIGLWLYDLIAGKRTRQYLSGEQFLRRVPQLKAENLDEGYVYQDAATDDTRLVFRMVQEAAQDGAYVLNRCGVTQLMQQQGQVQGAVLHDQILGEHLEVKASVVINATGVQVDGLRKQVGGERKIRPVRGSHLIVPLERLPLKHTVSFADPEKSNRPMFAYPWEGATVIGTTDLDHKDAVDTDVSMSAAELTHLLEAVNGAFPNADINTDDIICSYSGIRPLVDDGSENSDEASRHHEVWNENGLITVTGGKLTTFRLTAVDALNKARKQLKTAGIDIPKFRSNRPIVAPVDFSRPEHPELTGQMWHRLSGRYGNVAREVVACAAEGELTKIAGTQSCLAELRWALRSEMVETLADALLRRTRLGMLLPEGGKKLFKQVQQLCEQELSWTKEEWQQELSAYQSHYQQYYGLPQNQ